MKISLFCLFLSSCGEHIADLLACLFDNERWLVRRLTIASSDLLKESTDKRAMSYEPSGQLILCWSDVDSYPVRGVSVYAFWDIKRVPDKAGYCFFRWQDRHFRLHNNTYFEGIGKGR